LYSDILAFIKHLINEEYPENISDGIYLIIDLNGFTAEPRSLIDMLSAFNQYPVLEPKCILLAQFNSSNLTVINQEKLRAVYPISILNNRIVENRLYKQSLMTRGYENSENKNNVEIMDLATYQTDAAGNILACNSAFAQLIGYTVEELLVCNANDIISGRRDLFPGASTLSNNDPFTVYHCKTQYLSRYSTYLNLDEIMCMNEKENESSICHLLKPHVSESNNYHLAISGKSTYYHRLFGTGSGEMIFIEPISDKSGHIYDARIMGINPSYQEYLRTFGIINTEQSIRQVNACSGDLWIQAIDIVLQNKCQVYFETHDILMDRFFDILVFSSFSDKLAAIIIDVTQTKKIEDHCQKQIFFLKDILDGVPTPAFYRDTCGKFQYSNQAFELAVGLNREAILGKSIFKVLPEDLASKYRAMDLDLLSNAGIQTYEWEFQHADGNRHDVIFSKAPLSNSDGDFIGVVGTFTDITERKRVQEALRLSEEKFRSVFNQSPIGIAIYSTDGDIVDVNMAVKDILGIEDIEEIHHFNIFADKHFKPEDTELLKNLTIVSYEEELDFERIRKNTTFKTSKHGKSFIKYFISPLRSPDGSIEGFLVHLQDITEQKKAAQDLQASEANLRRLNDNMIDMIAQVNTNCDYEYITPSCQSMLGYEPYEMMGHSFYDLIHPKDIEKVCKHFMEAIKSKSFAKFDYRYKRSDDTYLYMETVANIIADGKGRIYGAVLVTRDITERKRMEGELSRLDRLKTVGEMAAGLGHEIRNPMTTVRGFLQMIGETNDFKQYKEIFDLMIAELDDVNSIITEYLSLAKDKTLYPEQENLNDILMAIYPLISADAIKSDKQVIMKLKTIPDLMLDAKEIRQLILNITRNGLESMDSGGILTIKTYMANHTVVMKIKDQGSGIPDDILDNLGTPFNTTKEQGIGLGLPICFNIATRHNAIIDVDTSPNGTIFWVRFKL